MVVVWVLTAPRKWPNEPLTLRPTSYDEIRRYWGYAPKVEGPLYVECDSNGHVPDWGISRVHTAKELYYINYTLWLPLQK